jgi:hypothetical protein
VLLFSAGGNYSHGFVNEFKIFIDELRDFFNAAGLTQLLENVKGPMSAEDQQVSWGEGAGRGSPSGRGGDVH